MGVMQRMARDLRLRRNLDIYLTIIAAVVISALSYLDIVPQRHTSSLVLAVLAVLAFNSLATRTLVEERSNSDLAVPLLRDFPADLTELREQADDVYLIGVSLERTLETSYVGLERNLRRGSRLRVLLTDPDADDAAVDARCQSSRPHPDDIRMEIRHSLKKLARLANTTNGDVEVRLTTSALKFGVNLIQKSRNAPTLLCVQLYTFRCTGESRPIIALSPRDSEWFEWYRSQAEALWDDATRYDLKGGSGHAATTAGAGAVPSSPATGGRSN